MLYLLCFALLWLLKSKCLASRLVVFNKFAVPKKTFLFSQFFINNLVLTRNMLSVPATTYLRLS